MPADIINFRKAKKAKARSDKDKRAEANRQKFGLTKAEKSREEAARSLNTKLLDAHRITKPDGAED